MRRIIEALVSQAESSSSSIVDTPVFNQAVKEASKVINDHVDSVAQNMEQDLALQLKEKEKLLLERVKLLTGKDYLIQQKRELIHLLARRLCEFGVCEFEKSQRKKSEEAISCRSIFVIIMGMTRRNAPLHSELFVKQDMHLDNLEATLSNVTAKIQDIAKDTGMVKKRRDV
ncbi:hypothetical protein FNV43_RR15151 [Rhamnella rubrinervis]|uniref:Uncharacterized protein n=1 Tax=Rhamnella rubrinervis TaxID=2594499 RepID=A0A8K0GX84_9ROSA|nr:hypothetical protein FNV43_RR15151 [Rhamnella rubrinervis]